MFSKNINFENFKKKKFKFNQKKLKKILKDLIKGNNQIIFSLTKFYKDKYNKKILLKLKRKKKINVIGMGGSILGSRAIYNFLKPKNIEFNFIDSFQNENLKSKLQSKNLNLIISKSGNTLETISNSNILIDKKNSNFFITENKKSYLMELANELKSEVIHHNNYIGGRYSVLSEVGMLPAELMGYNPKRFRRLNDLVKNKSFINNLILNVSNINELIKKKKVNSIILNYDDRSKDFFNWYQQLVAESLGKKFKGILPVVSKMPADNHSLMQYYLDGAKNHFFTFFFVKDKSFESINKKNLLYSYKYLNGKSLNDISFSQFLATKKIFEKKNIPFRSFYIKKRNEECLGELFSFFILETILLGKLMKINPFDQPAVELIKKETKKILISKKNS